MFARPTCRLLDTCRDATASPAAGGTGSTLCPPVVHYDVIRGPLQQSTRKYGSLKEQQCFIISMLFSQFRLYRAMELSSYPRRCILGRMYSISKPFHGTMTVGRQLLHFTEHRAVGMVRVEGDFRTACLMRPYKLGCRTSLQHLRSRGRVGLNEKLPRSATVGCASILCIPHDRFGTAAHRPSTFNANTRSIDADISALSRERL